MNQEEPSLSPEQADQESLSPHELVHLLIESNQSVRDEMIQLRATAAAEAARREAEELASQRKKKWLKIAATVGALLFVASSAFSGLALWQGRLAHDAANKATVALAQVVQTRTDTRTLSCDQDNARLDGQRVAYQILGNTNKLAAAAILQPQQPVTPEQQASLDAALVRYDKAVDDQTASALTTVDPENSSVSCKLLGR